MESTIAGRSKVQRAGLLAGPLLALAVGVGFDPVPGQPAIGAVAAVVVLMACWWMTERLPCACS
jgi:di/tricarboxylate transporter